MYYGFEKVQNRVMGHDQVLLLMFISTNKICNHFRHINYDAII